MLRGMNNYRIFSLRKIRAVRTVAYLIFHVLPFFTVAQTRYDILITEFLPDPSPAVGMPESEFIELKNRSSRDYNLKNWKISNGNSSALIKTDYLLKADSFLIICSISSETAFSSFGSTLGVSSFPSINNEAGELILTTDGGMVMHAIQYDKTWYGNELKAAGGWSLEMIDPGNPCTGKGNWTASISPSGGTPGIKNSVDGENTDSEPPALIRAVATDSLDVLLLFDEPVDSAAAGFSDNYFISDGVGLPENAAAKPPFFDRSVIHLQKPLASGKTYTVSVNHIQDCNGNEINGHNTCKAGLPEKPGSGDVIFNEILFNPPSYGYDYLELYNRSSKIISCPELYLAGRDALGDLKNPVPLLTEERQIFPEDYLLLTENEEWTLQNYPLASAAPIIVVSALPSLPDDAGKVVLLNATGEIIDELDYDHHWHSPLLANETGVALERIRSDLPTQLSSNWTSAAASAGFGTPGYKNSESYPDSSVMDLISVEPELFSPDMDGYHDFCFINYHLPAAGFAGSISIYDISGRMVRKLVNNLIWGISGTYRWDGLDDQQNLLPTGHYVICVELFRTDGTVINKKLVCVLARRH
jgi:Lamin Tail Domain